MDAPSTSIPTISDTAEDNDLGSGKLAREALKSRLLINFRQARLNLRAVNCTSRHIGNGDSQPQRAKDNPESHSVY